MTNKFYHSSIDIIEYPFDKVFLDKIDDNLILIIKQFNASKNKIEKIELSKKIPINFPKCRFCNTPIINANFYISYNIKKKCIKIITPNIYCREIDGKKYYLSCCEDCLLEHFKDNPPKSLKYYFMKANKYGQYSYGYSDEEYKKICSMTVGVTKQNMIRKWGKDEGERRWNEYCNKQSITNTYEYKKEKYNWTKEDFENFNKSRAVTLKNLINKYGEDLGTQYFNDYVNKQKLTKSREYMIKKFGEEKTNQINVLKGQTIENYINRLGYDEGLKQFEIMLSHHHNFFSKISQKFFDELDSILSKKYTTYYATKNQEYGVMLSDKQYIRLDYFIKELNLCIEFNGTYYHADPKLFNENDYPNPHNKVLTAKQIWERDNDRYKLLKESRNIDTIIVWENDYRNGLDINDFIKNTLHISI